MYSLRECCDKPIDGKEQQDIIIHWPSDYLIVCAGQRMNQEG